MSDESWQMKFYKDRDYFNPGDTNKVKEFINIDEETAVEIADHYFKKCSDRKYEVYFDEENEWYLITSRYIIDWEDRIYGSENECKILIDSKNGAILDIGYILY